MDLKKRMSIYRTVNRDHYYSVLRDAQYIIQKAIRGKQKIAVALSGGKDSVAMAGLVCKFCKPVIVWNDSGLELPESGEIVKQIVDRFGLEIIIAPGNAIEEAEKVSRGELARDDRRVLLSIDTIVKPVKKAIDENGIDLEFVGLREAESKNRRMLIRVRGPIHESKKWGITIAWPMRKWTGADCLAYICEHDLPLHPSYLKSNDPENTRVSWVFDKTREAPAETEHIRREYPSIYRKLREIGVCR